MKPPPPPIEEPMRAVVKMRVMTTPRGRTVVLIRLECGHESWSFRRRPPTRPAPARRCTTCWISATLAAEGNASGDW